jgi:ATP-dependent DNA helicase 2 subunit 2
VLSIDYNALLHGAYIETDNVIHRKDGGYDHVTEFVQIGQPNADTLAKVAAVQASNVSGDRP